jgi:PKD repeat protein
VRSFGVALLALVLVPSYASAAACIWFADGESIKQVNTGDNTIAVEVPMAAPRRLAMNESDCSIWALRNSNGRLRKFDPAGTEVRNVNVLALDPLLTEALRIRLDPFDDSLWVTGERRIVHLDAEARAVIAAFDAPADIRRFRVGMDQDLWVLGRRKLWRFSREGGLLEERPLDPVLEGEAKHFAVDELRRTIWVAGETQIARMSSSSNSPDAPAVVAQVPEGTTGFALDPVTGRVWFGRPASIEGLNPDGTPFAQVDLAALGLTGLHKLRFDPASRSLWAGFPQQLVRFTDDGVPAATLAAVDYDDEAIGVPPFKVRPRVTLERPPENGIVDRRRPVLELQYGARCNGSACDVPRSYFVSAELAASLNGTPVGAAFELDPATGKATFRPADALPQGPSSFTARLTDRFGHKSNAIDTVFTVDTIAPAFGPIDPPAGTTVPSAQVTLSGTISEPGSAVILNNAQALNPQGPNPQFPQPPDLAFSWGLTLQPGANDLQLSAIDPAGNVSSTTHSLIFGGGGGVAPQVAIQSPAVGAAIADDQVIVTGTWSGPANTGITVNGVVAALDGNQFFATVPLVPGANTVTVLATITDGTQVSATVQVTSAGPSPVRVSASVLQGFAPLEVSFTITSDREIQSVDGSFAPGSPFSVSPLAGPLSFTYGNPGAYEALFNIRHTDGTTVTKTVRIVVQTTEQVDQQLRQAWGGMTAALARGDAAGALQYFNAPARARYAPVFEALLPGMGQIVASFSALQTMQIDESIGEYVINRVIDGVEHAFFVYFVRDVDGVWRLETM